MTDGHSHTDTVRGIFVHVSGRVLFLFRAGLGRWNPMRERRLATAQTQRILSLLLPSWATGGE